jgi:hypothetical protein
MIGGVGIGAAGAAWAAAQGDAGTYETEPINGGFTVTDLPAVTLSLTTAPINGGFEVDEV